MNIRNIWIFFLICAATACTEDIESGSQNADDDTASEESSSDNDASTRDEIPVSDAEQDICDDNGGNAAAGQSCCRALGVDACEPNFFCAALDGRTIPSCHVERSREIGESCEADKECRSGACNTVYNECIGTEEYNPCGLETGCGGDLFCISNQDPNRYWQEPYIPSSEDEYTFCARDQNSSGVQWSYYIGGSTCFSDNNCLGYECDLETSRCKGTEGDPCTEVVCNDAMIDGEALFCDEVRELCTYETGGGSGVPGQDGSEAGEFDFGCADFVDGDNDNLIDCEDPDCYDSFLCAGSNEPELCERTSETYIHTEPLEQSFRKQFYYEGPRSYDFDVVTDDYDCCEVTAQGTALGLHMKVNGESVRTKYDGEEITWSQCGMCGELDIWVYGQRPDNETYRVDVDVSCFYE